MTSRARVWAIVGLACAAAAAIAIGVAWAGRAESPEVAAPAPRAPREGAPPLALDVLVEDAALAGKLQDAARLYDDGQRTAAREAFAKLAGVGEASLYADVGEAMARWPNGTLARLQELAGQYPDSGLVLLHLGLTRFWLRQDAAAARAWEETEARDPDSSAAIRAESLLHPDMPTGRPYFVPSTAVPQALADLLPLQQLRELERRAQAGGDLESWILYGVALQRAGRPVSAVEAFDRAVAVAPDSPEALAAAAVARFDKDEPSQAFSRLGPLGDRFPDAAVVRFHLGLMLLWLRDVEGSRAQLERAVELEPGSIYARQSSLLLDRLEEAGAGTTTGP